MPAIRAATFDDAAAIVSFLVQNLSAHPERHSRVVGCQWENSLPNIGFVIEDAGQIVGYLGGLYSRRRLAGVERIFCNMTSWTVLPKYRAYSIGLLKAMLAQPNLTITNYSASETVRKILSTFRFQPLDAGCVRLPALSLMPRHLMSPGWTISVGAPALAGIRDPEALRLMAEHMRWSCMPVMMERGEASRLLLLQAQSSGIRRVAEILYCSDWSKPETWQPAAAMAAWRHLNAPWLSVEARRAMPAAFSRPWLKPAFFHSNDGVEAVDIDRLFTEMVPRHGELQ
jgi:hypothetical protein